MGTNYPGYETFTPIGGSPSGFGRWITGLAVDDDDNDDAAHLNALAMAAVDSIQWLGWRTYDIVSGGTYIFTSTITTSNGFNFIGTALRFSTNTKFDNGRTTNIGDPAGTTGVHHVVVNPDSDITIGGSFGHPGQIIVNQFGQIEVKSGAILKTDSGSSSIFAGAVEVTNSPAATADPGNDNMLTGPNIEKCWGRITTDGSGGLTLVDGYNVSGITFNGTNAITVTFARAVLSGYACEPSEHSGATASYRAAKAWSLGATTFQISVFSDWAATVNLTTTAVDISFKVSARQ
jgi:hypothetical protein